MGGYMHPHPTPPQKPARQNRAAFPKNFFEILFFCFSSSSFAGFFWVKRPKIGYFLDVGVVLDLDLAVFGYFWVVFRRFRVLDEGLYVLH